MASSLLNKTPGEIGAMSRALASVFAQLPIPGIAWQMPLSGSSLVVRVMALRTVARLDMMPTVVIAMLFSQLLKLVLGSR